MIDLRPMFRAVPRDTWRPSQRHVRLETRRTPSNVPYVVDNLWEYLRPESAPSRRHAVYASPTPELALINAMGTGQDRSAFVATRVVFHGAMRQVQLSCSDARHHPDVARLPRLVLQGLGAGWADLPFNEKGLANVLFTPGVTRDEIDRVVWRCERTLNAIYRAQDACTMWTDADNAPADNGEFFFELFDESFYTLEALP